jgi:predicted amidophosphoribosyltransferase
MNCPLCGNKFEKGNEIKCTGCGKLHNCKKQCCPNCGYELVKEAKLIQMIRGLFK